MQDFVHQQYFDGVSFDFHWKAKIYGFDRKRIRFQPLREGVFVGILRLFTKVINLHDMSCFKLRVRWRSWTSECFMFQEMLCNWFVSVDKKHTVVVFVFPSSVWFSQIQSCWRNGFWGWIISPNSRNIMEKGSGIRCFKDGFQLGNPSRLQLFDELAIRNIWHSTYSFRCCR